MFCVAELSSQFDCLPNGDPIPGASRSGCFYSADLSSPARNHYPGSPVRVSPPSEPSLRDRSRSPPARTHYPGSPVSASPPSEPPLRVKTRSPPADCIPYLRLGKLKIEEFKSVRLIPNTNPKRKFEIRRYTFPREAPIQLRGKNHSLEPMPTDEQTVLSTKHGDVLAIFERSNTYLRGIYIGRNKRIKINMHTGKVEGITEEESEESPLGKNCPISRNFKKMTVEDFRPKH